MAPIYDPILLSSSMTQTHLPRLSYPISFLTISSHFSLLSYFVILVVLLEEVLLGEVLLDHLQVVLHPAAHLVSIMWFGVCSG